MGEQSRCFGIFLWVQLRDPRIHDWEDGLLRNNKANLFSRVVYLRGLYYDFNVYTLTYVFTETK